MNHFAHAWVASRVRLAPRFVLGAMLPDLTGFLRLRLPEAAHPEIREGVRLHHACDAVFHQLPAFRTANQSGVQALRRRGLARGAARAASHVGLELVLDAALAASHPPTLEHYRAALRESEDLEPASEDPLERLQQMARRLAASNPASSLGDPSIVAERVRRTLERRPALALRREEVPPLESWLAEIEPFVVSEAHALASATLARVIA